MSLFYGKKALLGALYLATRNLAVPQQPVKINATMAPRVVERATRELPRFLHSNIFNQPFLTRELKGTVKQKAKRMLILITLLSLTVAVAAVAYAVMLRRRYREN